MNYFVVVYIIDASTNLDVEIFVYVLEHMSSFGTRRFMNIQCSNNWMKCTIGTSFWVPVLSYYRVQGHACSLPFPSTMVQEQFAWRVQFWRFFFDEETDALYWNCGRNSIGFCKCCECGMGFCCLSRHYKI